MMLFEVLPKDNLSQCLCKSFQLTEFSVELDEINCVPPRTNL